MRGYLTKQPNTITNLRNMISVWSILDGFYIPTRYPNGVPDSIPARVYTKYAAIQAAEMADEIVEFVRRKMGEIDR